MERTWGEVPSKEDVLFRTDSELSEANARVRDLATQVSRMREAISIAARELPASSQNGVGADFLCSL